MIKLMNESIKPNKSQVIEASIDLLQTAKKSLSSIQKKLSKEKHEESDNIADAYDLVTKALSNLEGSKVLTESSSITKSDESTVINEATDEFDPKKFLSKLIVRYQDIDAAFSDLSKKGLLPDGSKVNRSKGRLEVKGYAFKPVIKLGKNASPENAVATGEWTYSKLKESMNEAVKYDISGATPTGAGDYIIDEERGISSPAKAIELWFKIEAKHPLNTDISAYKKADAIALITWAYENQDKITEWHKKYRCPYKLESMLAAIERQFNNKCKSFSESEYGEMIDPFCIG